MLLRPVEIEGEGGEVIFITIGSEITEQPLPSVTSTVIESRSSKSDLEIVDTVLLAPKLVPPLKNSYRTPPEALKRTASPKQAVLVPVNEARGSGETESRTVLLIKLQVLPLKVLIATRLKSVSVDTEEGVYNSPLPAGNAIGIKVFVPDLLSH